MRTVEGDDCLMQKFLDYDYIDSVEIIIDLYGVEPFMKDLKLKETLYVKAKRWASKSISDSLAVYEKKIFDEVDTKMAELYL